MTDPIADMLARIKNAQAADMTLVQIPHSNHLLAIAETLKAKGFVASVDVKGEVQKTIHLELSDKEITGTKRVSRPSRRVYKSHDELNKVKGGYGHMILSTPQGLMCDTDARKNKVGGEALFEIW